jgi:hypothetical protein
MAPNRRGDDWRPNANETGVVNDFNLAVAGVGAVGGGGWAGLRALARRLGLPLTESPRRLPASAVSVCIRCGTALLVGEAACLGCGRPTPRLTVAATPMIDIAGAASRRRRADLVLALVVALVVGLGILLIARTMERGQVQALALQLWWLAGLFWGGFVLLTRMWLDQ